MGPTRMRFSQPVIAAIDGYAVAGGLELALWCDTASPARAGTAAPLPDPTQGPTPADPCRPLP